MVEIDTSDRVCFMYNAIQSHEGNASFPEANQRLKEALTQYCAENKEAHEIWETHHRVLLYLEQFPDVTNDSNYMRHIYDRCDSKLSLDKKVAIAQTAWAKLLRIRAQALGLEGKESSLPQCFRCGESATKRCSRCHKQRYCGRECQQLDWGRHKQWCGKDWDAIKRCGKGWDAFGDITE